MWNLTPDYLASVKEELKGRRAAIQARIADELKAIDEDLEEVETLERIAYAFAVKHLSDGEAPMSASPQEPAAEPEGMASLQGGQPAEPDTNDGAVPAPRGGVSRWRIRLDRPAEAESA
jgi:hypothetical protein